MSFVDPPFNTAYRKRHFFDMNQKKMENNIKKTDAKNKILIRTSLTENERIIQGINAELKSYKKMLLIEQDDTSKLRSELYRLSNENRKYKLQLLTIQRVIDELSSNNTC